MKTLHRRPWLVFQLGLLTLALLAAIAEANALAAQEQAGKKPKIFALIHVAPLPPTVMGGGQPKMDREEFVTFLRTQEALLQTRVVLKAALARPEVAKLPTVKQQKAPLLWLEEKVLVQADPKTGILRVAVADGKPDEQVALVNAVVEVYLNEFVNREHDQRLARIDQLKELHAKFDAQLREKRIHLRQMAENLGSKDARALGLKHQLALQHIQALQQELLQVQSDVRKTKLEVEWMGEAAGKQGKDVPVNPRDLEEAVNRDPAVARLVREIGELEVTLATIKRVVSIPEQEKVSREPEMRLAAAKKELTTLRDGLRVAVTKQLREHQRAEMEAKLQDVKGRATRLRRLEEVLTAELAQRMAGLVGQQKSTVELEWLREEIAHLEAMAVKVGQQVQLLQVEAQAPPRVRLIHPAEVPDP
jgi:hypothetical protein